ncbi:MAG: hypothetical protein COT24_00930 [Candidatus Kerfeldbacteria bacterium CG08_land_8_20_14_0_20_40_16]|uniref:Aminoglycoside phosphotransferase domain-containing protein n=1 Tax=Candidatus Kerfeldbacteria bacterium CG08_land_8_20_14_0_20_40_16 TaxID=2014244 RepID=A0A2H0YWY3_9BACT|nr:MAG: hypothetical protein COT24_00930 [Candidatus Kerfeldbacteria bacterium CG08_land_8_20_14_0_20_40_16]
MIQKPKLVQIQKVVKNVFPKAKVINFKRTSLGNINWVYVVKVANPSKKIILKVVYRKDREEQEILAKENKIIGILNDKKIEGIPKVIDFNHSKKDVPWVYMIESYLDGYPIIERQASIKGRDFKGIIKKLAKIITGFHKIRYKKITEFEKLRPEFTSFPVYLEAYLEKYCLICNAYSKMPKQLIQDANEFLLRESPKIKDKQFVLNHCDASSHNILIKGNKFVGLVDFEAAQTMTPEFDLVTCYHEFLWRYPKLWQLLLKEYVKYNKIPKDFKERLNIVMGYRSLRYLYIAVKNKIFQYMEGDIQRMKEVLDGSFLKTIKF